MAQTAQKPMTVAETRAAVKKLAEDAHTTSLMLGAARNLPAAMITRQAAQAQSAVWHAFQTRGIVRAQIVAARPGRKMAVVFS
jgi:hypothetical protein